MRIGEFRLVSANRKLIQTFSSDLGVIEKTNLLHITRIKVTAALAVGKWKIAVDLCHAILCIHIHQYQVRHFEIPGHRKYARQSAANNIRTL